VGTVGSTDTTVERTYSKHLTERNYDLVRRLVGYYEYGRALEHFDTLLEQVDDQELAAIEEIIQGRDELAVYTNLSRRFQTEPSILADSDNSPLKGVERRGFGWVLALARVELGAMLAGFTDRQQPFAAVRPSRYELPQYADLLLDGLQTHYWALKQERDGQLKQVVRGNVPIQRLLVYGRRVMLTRAFLQAVATIMGGELSPNQAAELRTWDDQLNEVQYAVVTSISSLLASQTTVQQRSSTYATVNACGALLRAVDEELAAGTATVNNFEQTTVNRVPVGTSSGGNSNRPAGAPRGADGRRGGQGFPGRNPPPRNPNDRPD